MELTEYQHLTQWVDEEGRFDLRSYILLNASVPDAAVLAELFWPRFVQYRGRVFLAFMFDADGVETWFDNLKGDVSATESMINHVHLWDLFSPRSPDEYAGLSSLAERMRTMWACALREAFPDRTFDVTLADESADYGPTLSFSEKD
ncbi:hypothetical protein DER29_1096 [Micromonospora sp. M71_S20]|uniref:hypothetical protein n=1 Tax=Micromonospora sp. M71_S20 TaxID=592872 RepID=UPI000EAC07E0|nr:hypothetical protein [Micromonospora sp. M71_S20]RLK23236.1 hypothetical protein DER29_1096 [Micromonospora sp. M71_S20]